MTSNIHSEAIDLINEELVICYEAIAWIKREIKRRQREWQQRQPYREVKGDSKHRTLSRSLKLNRRRVAELEETRRYLKSARNAALELEHFKENPEEMFKRLAAPLYPLTPTED